MLQSKSSEIYIKNPYELERKLQGMSLSNMRVVSDFDSTMTSAWSYTSWDVINKLPQLNDWYTTLRKAYFDEYHPHEINPVLTKAQRDILMSEWWRKHTNLFEQFLFQQEYLARIDTTWVIMRSGIQESFNVFKENNIPVLVLSAWISQAIERILHIQKMIHEDMAIIANEMLFDDNGKYIGVYPSSCIHTGNKNEQNATMKVKSWFINRTKILLLGDHIDDIHMVSLDEREETVAIWFCSNKKREQIDTYTNLFDIVIRSDDSDCGVLAGIIERIYR